jgi:hypothetical protein
LLQANSSGRASTLAGAEYMFHYWMPASFACTKCTLQWWWMSANSGAPHPDAYNCYFQKIEQLGWNAQAWCSGACSYSGPCPTTQNGPINVGEQFKNCADVSVVDNGASGDGRAGTAAPTPAPPSPMPGSSTAPMTPSPTQQSTMPATPTDCSGQPCDSMLHCRSQWGHCGASSDYCNSESTWTAPCSEQGSSSEPEPESEPGSEPESETESETEVTPSANGGAESAECAAVAGLNRGVSDSDCAHCLSGRTYWPCNEQALCVCPSHCLFDQIWKCSGSLTQVRAPRHLRKGSASASLTAGTAFVQQTNTMTVHKLSDEL